MFLAIAALALGSPLTLQRYQFDITPPEPLPLGGYTARQGRVMQPGGEPLYARTLLFRRGSFSLAIVSVEMLTIPDSLAREVRRRIPNDIQLFLCATHTHSAPDSQMLNDRMTFAIPGIATFKSRWLRWYADKIASSVVGAMKQHPEKVSRLGTDTFEVALNRGRRKGADPETLATVIWENRHRAIAAQYAAHAVLYGPERNQTSGDWPGSLSRRNKGMLVLMGAIGDVSPAASGKAPRDRIRNFVRTFDRARHHPQSSAEVWDSSNAGGTGPSTSFGCISQPITLDPVQPHPNFGKDYRIPQALAQTLAAKFAPSEANITAVRIGSMAIVGIPGEPTSHLGRRIREAGLKMGFTSVLVVSHVNGWIGYILDPVDYSQGGYEADLSFYGPQEGEHVVEAASQALLKLSALPG